ncbi:hypothetical protein N7508_000948 [Penicillium antarcticum]|uniref:uncharacterized protein n=1 Tax=Penicillium antarcticum TaxID=416450 RepID=UPI00239660F6|nr:uncharacterized protein N7508_000948 [Penicillium antarcticum]KAJ5320665.1 hypothetical protein N7508_000948 [Penicillium antarcticum]
MNIWTSLFSEMSLLIAHKMSRLIRCVTTANYNTSLTIDMIRKYLGSVVEGKHGSALVSQIYGHKDAGTYPKAYLLHCSSIDTVSAVLGEEDQSHHIEYFQGVERFYKHGLPGELPAEIEASILQNPELIEDDRWVRERRDQRILSRGKEEPVISDNDVYTRAQSFIMPEIARISALMSSDKELSFNEMLLFVDDLKSHCGRDFEVAYS